MINQEQENAKFVIRCYRQLYRLGRLSGKGVERHNELVKEYRKRFTDSRLKTIKMTKRIKDNIRTNTNKWFMRRRYDNFNGHEVNVFCGLYQPCHNRSQRTMKYVRMAGTK